MARRAGLVVGCLTIAASTVIAGCGTSSGANAASLAGSVVSAMLTDAPKKTRRSDTYEYRASLQRAKEGCWSARSQARFVVLDGSEHVGADRAEVRFVRFGECRLDWLDGCHAKSGAEYSPRGKLAGGAPRVDEVEDEIDLMELFPTWSPTFVGRVAKGARLRVELRAASSRGTEQRFTRADLAWSEACAAATHWVSNIEYGALRVNVDAPAYAAERELEAQKELGLGSYGACLRDEEGACEAPVAITIIPFAEAPSR